MLSPERLETEKSRRQRRRAGRIHIIVLQLKAGDFSDLPQQLGPDWMHLSVHDEMRLGVNAPQGVPPNVWINIVTTLFAARAGLISARVTLANVIRWLLPVLNPQPGRRLLWPDWQLILEIIRHAPPAVLSAKGEYTQSLRQALDDITQSSGSLLRAFSGFDLEEHVVARGKNVVIDIANLYPPWLRLFVVDLLVSQLLVGRSHRHHRVDATEVLLVIDEGDALVSRKTEACFPDGLSPIALAEKQGREFGIACCLGLTALGNASRFVLSNAQYHLIFNLADDESVVEAARTLMLPQGAHLQFPALAPGQAILRESQGAWPHALWTAVDYVPPNRKPPPQHYDTHPFIPSKRLHELSHVMAALEKLITEHKRTRLRQAKETQRGEAPALSQQAHRLISLWAVKPYTPVARLWDELGRPSPSVQANVRSELEAAKLAEFEEERVGRRNVLLLELTAAGWKHLQRTPPKRKGRGGIAHRHYCHAILRYETARGNKARLEAVVPNTAHPADVAVLTKGGLHVYEVVSTQDANLLSHLQACFVQSDRVRTVTVVAPLKSDLKELEHMLDADLSLLPFRSRITFEPVGKYL
ncbi:hypothetical protein ACFL09_00160 [Planctomycetota bacterium]